MKRFMVFISSLLALNAHAQKDRFILKISPLALADFVNFPTAQLGLETRLSPRISWYNELGIRCFNYSFDPADTSFLSPRGFKAKTEFRYYFQNRDKKRRPAALSDVYYIAVNAFYIRDVHNRGISYYYNNDSSQVRRDDFGVKKTVWGLNFIFGYQEAIGKRFLFDIYGGPGIRFRSIDNVNKEFVYESDKMITAKDMNVNAITVKTESRGGFSVGPNLSFGIRLCYRL